MRVNVTPPAVALPVACAGCAVVAVGAVVLSESAGADAASFGDGALSCPVRALTGWWCPGCGLTRATHHLFRGNVGTALSLNLFGPVILVALVALWLVWLSVAVGRGVPRSVATIRHRWYWAAGAVLVGFTALRNLPGAELLRGG